MQPLKITIPGNFWDSYIYSGRLYLFGLDGDIRTIGWDSLLESWRLPETLRLPMECAFRRSDFLYGTDIQTLVRDSDVKALIREKFVELGRRQLLVSEGQLSRHEEGRQDNPFPFPHADCEIYNRRLYVVAPSGVFQATASSRTKNPISTRVVKRWDAPVHRLSPSWGQLALAAGSEGLYEMPVDLHEEVSVDANQISDHHCSDCNWNYHSIFGSSYQGGFFAEYGKEAVEEGWAHRSLRRILSENELWGEAGYSWGVKDKLCLATKNGIRVLKYEPWENEPHNQIHSLGTFQVEIKDKKIVSASAAPFGLVIELDDALVIYPSEGSPLTISGEPTNWRVFQRAKHYENQLHVIWPDRLEILSFNHDYLVDQAEKLLGLSVLGNVRRM